MSDAANIPPLKTISLKGRGEGGRAERRSHRQQMASVSDIPCIMRPGYNLSLMLGPGQINFVTESSQQALTDLLNPNYCLELHQGSNLDNLTLTYAMTKTHYFILLSTTFFSNLTTFYSLFGQILLLIYYLYL